jgi:hypothetical protein
VCLAYTHLETLQLIFKDQLSENDIKQINSGRQKKNYTNIHKGVFTKNEVTYLRQPNSTLLTNLASAAHRFLDIPIKSSGNDLMDVNEIAEKMDIQVVVHLMNRNIMHSTIEKPTKIFILLDNNHYDSIVNISGFKGAQTKLYCKACNTSPECKHLNGNTKVCTVCNKLFYNEGCLKNHITNKRCSEHSFRCNKCVKVMKTKDRQMMEHICGEFRCTNCKYYVMHPHECFMQRKPLNPPSELYKFYDFETYLNEHNKHVVNFAVLHDFDGNEWVFNNLNDFCTHIFRKQNKGYTFIAHNAKGYDVQFILNWLIGRKIKPNIIKVGNKILSLEVKLDYNIRFIDSLSFNYAP